MMIKTLIVDDEPLAHDVVKTYLNEVPELTLVGQCYSASEALAFVKDHRVDLIFLDIEMPVLNGLAFLSMLEEKPQVIVTSAYQQYAIDGFEMDVADYLLKPFRFDRFTKAVDKVKRRLMQSADANVAVDKSLDSIFIKVDKKQVKIQLAQVSCFEAYGNYVKVWRDNQSLLTAKTLSYFEQTLPPDKFVRVHKSAIINRDKIDYIEADTLHLTDGKTVAIGKQYKSNLL